MIEAGEERVDLAAALDTLAVARGVERVRGDCGGRLAGALLHAGLEAVGEDLVWTIYRVGDGG